MFRPPRLRPSSPAGPFGFLALTRRRGITTDRIIIPTGRTPPSPKVAYHLLSPPAIGEAPWTGLLTLQSNEGKSLDPVLCLATTGGLHTKLSSLPVPAFPLPTHPVSPVKHAIRTSSIPGAGLGVFALQDLARGETVWRERPLVVTGYGTQALLAPPKVPHAVEVAVMELHNSFADSSTSFASQLPGVLRTNAVDVPILANWEPQAVLFSTFSRLNHSFVIQINFLLLVGLTIMKGEEIFTSYSDHTLSFTERASQLIAARRGFTCSCRICRLPSDARTKSDKRRKWLFSDTVDKKFDPQDDSSLWNWAGDPKLPEDHIIKECRGLWDAAAEEGVHSGAVLAAAQRMCKAYCALRKRDEAKKWATIARELTHLQDTFAAPALFQQWQRVIDKPDLTDWWGRVVPR
ncbi:hypothetical protein C8R46DRAFT_1283250 [Mycena filopes]|nr:hypothetical protein C8R46DRAFT_1283250 [Mycena filopes]